MVTLEEVFVHPLFLLLIGAVISYVLGSRLTNRWQTNMKKLDIKVDIWSKIGELVAYQVAKTSKPTIERKEKFNDDDKKEYFEDLIKRYVDYNTIRSKLEIYFPTSDIIGKWDEYFMVLTAFSNASRQYFEKTPILEHQIRNLHQNLGILNNYLSQPSHRVRGIGDQIVLAGMTYDEETWGFVKAAIITEGNILTTDIVVLPIKGF